MEKIRVCLWATTLQANIFSFARYLAGQSDFETVVVTENVAEYKKEPVNGFLPLNCPVLERDSWSTERFLKKFKADVTVVDNHYPKKKISEGILVLWHGFGWKGPENRQDFDTPFREVQKLTGISPDLPNPFFRWICAGPANYDHRKNITGIAAENLRVEGQPYYDDIVNAKFDKDRLLEFYPGSFKGKKIALLAFTWHYGKILSHWGEDIVIFDRLLSLFDELGIASIIRMHDRKRFEKNYLDQLAELAGKHESVLLKYKDENRDNLLDIQISDMMISNFSSIITYYYASLKPSIHIYPVDRNSRESVYRVWKDGKVREKSSESADYIWSLPSDENGGLVVYSMEELFEAVKRSVQDPDCCKERSLNFMKKHLAPVDGKNCERIAGVLKEMVQRKG